MPPSKLPLTVIAALVLVAPLDAGSVVVTPVGAETAALVAVVVLRVVEVAVAPAVNAQVHSLESWLGLLEQFEAQDGRPVVAVTVDLVNVAQKEEAAALLALM